MGPEKGAPRRQHQTGCLLNSLTSFIFSQLCLSPFGFTYLVRPGFFSVCTLSGAGGE